MAGFLILIGIELFMLFKMVSDGIKPSGLEAFFGFFTFLGLAFLMMNVFNTTFPSISINAGQDKSSVRGFTKETFKSELDKDNYKKSIVLFNKTNLMYFIFFIINLIPLLVITFILY